MWRGQPAGPVTWTDSVWFNPASVVLTEEDVYPGNTQTKREGPHLPQGRWSLRVEVLDDIYPPMLPQGNLVNNKIRCMVRSYNPAHHFITHNLAGFHFQVPAYARIAGDENDYMHHTPQANDSQCAYSGRRGS